MFTKEGSATTPRLSAALAALVAGGLAGLYFSFRTSEGWGVVAGLLCAVVVFSGTYPTLRDEHDRQRLADPAPIPPVSFRERVRSGRPSLVRLAVVIAALPVGVGLSIVIDSIWGLVVAMAAALVAVTVMRQIDGRER